MIVRRRVENGVIVLSDCVRLPEGQDVTVGAAPTTGRKSHGILNIPILRHCSCKWCTLEGRNGEGETLTATKLGTQRRCSH